VHNGTKPLRISPWTININIRYWYNVITTTNRVNNSPAVYGRTCLTKYNPVFTIS